MSPYHPLKTSLAMFCSKTLYDSIDMNLPCLPQVYYIRRHFQIVTFFPVKLQLQMKIKKLISIELRRLLADIGSTDTAFVNKESEIFNIFTSDFGIEGWFGQRF